MRGGMGKYLLLCPVDGNWDLGCTAMLNAHGLPKTVLRDQLSVSYVGRWQKGSGIHSLKLMVEAEAMNQMVSQS